MKSTIYELIKPLEGYRALAILAVLIFHLDRNFLPGGFLGVDLFFVISGFIITKGLMTRKAQGRLKLSAFYLRRIRRLFPALLVTVTVTLIASWFILVPEEFAATGKSALFSLASLANISFWLESGYFAADAETKPLLHMWSLSVEEQFYLFWPLVFAVFGPKRWKVWTFVLLILSFGATVWFARMSPETGFFWFPFRIYEFMGGAILSILGLRLKNNLHATVALLAGSALFLYACFTFDAVSNLALTGGVTVIASMLLLLSMDSKLAETVFGNPIAIWIGQRSYSIYLVHWPLIVLYVSAYGGLNFVEMISLGLISFLLGAALKWLIEDPFRQASHPRSLSPSKAFGALIPVTAASGFLAAMIWINQGFPPERETQLKDYLVEDNRYQSLMRQGTCFLSTNDRFFDMPETCYKTVSGKQNMLLLGSSVAADLRYGLELSFPNWHISQITAARCNPFPGASRSDTCESVRNFVFEEVLDNQEYDLVILTWSHLKNAAQVKTIDDYMTQRGIDYVLIGSRPVFDQSPRQIIARHASLDGLDAEMQSHVLRQKDKLPRNPQRHYFSSIDAMCPSSDTCIWQIDGTLAYRDPLHLSPTGSEYLSAEFAKWYAERPSD
ncbi:acyltransferase family protein [Litorimonas sp. WD9-15]|uniref:acyltransferase family protein n=1 Tax=Litorimonas sp. WD9-15 TaxID=3418716 RepID=UPI003D035F11